MKSIYKILVFLILISCGNQESKTQDSTIKKILPKIKPILLGLSPQMNNNEFTSRIEQLERDGILIGGEFGLKINDENYSFEIVKHNDCISLQHKQSKSVQNSMDDNYVHSKHIKYNKQYTEKAKNVLKQFLLKYHKDSFQIPDNINLEAAGLTMENYTVFKDDEKYILFGYENISSVDPIELNSMLGSEKDSDSPKSAMGEMYNKMSRKTPLEYGVIININYYHPEDFKKIMSKVLEMSRNMQELKKEETNREDENQKNINRI